MCPVDWIEQISGFLSKWFFVLVFLRAEIFFNKKSFSKLLEVFTVRSLKKKKKASQLLLNALSRALHYAAVLVYTEYTSPLVTAQVAIQVFQRCFIVWDDT